VRGWLSPAGAAEPAIAASWQHFATATGTIALAAVVLPGVVR
jgi:hypothetical protein